MRLNMFKQYLRLSDLCQMYGGNVKETQSNAADGTEKITSGCGKKGDVYNLVRESFVKSCSWAFERHGYLRFSFLSFIPNFV